MDINQFSIKDFQWSEYLEREYTNYMDNCESLIDDDENGFVTLSGQPFCGCDVCYVREQLFFLVPRIIHAYKEGKVTVTDGEE